MTPLDKPIPPPQPIPYPYQRYAQYERMKAQLQRLCLTPQQYAQAVRKIVDWLGV